MANTKQIVDIAYREIVEKGYYDEIKGNAPIPGLMQDSMSSIPKSMTDYINECGYGCCFVFSAYMMDILNKYNINCYMIGTVEDSATRASVMYEDNGVFYIANPVEDIEYFTKHKIKSEDRADYYVGNSATMIIDGIEHNDSRFTIEDFYKKYGKIWIIGSMNKEAITTLYNSLSTCANRIIMPPEIANYNANSLLKK